MAIGRVLRLLVRVPVTLTLACLGVALIVAIVGLGWLMADDTDSYGGEL